MNDKTTKINVKVPRKYAQRKYLDAIGMGLFDLAIGIRPEQDDVEIDDLISARLVLSPKATQYWENLLPKYQHNQRRLIREALHLISLEPECHLQTRI